jgi:enoyl-CoA hydratase/carnithine racemase
MKLRHPPYSSFRRLLSTLTNTVTSPVISSVSKTTGVATITLNHPTKRNALSTEMLASLGREVDAVTSDQNTKVIIIRSSHSAVFSSGHDLGELVPGAKESSKTSNLSDKDIYEKHVNLFNLCSKVMLKVHNAPQPVIAEISGIATAAGCQLVASCDLAIASKDSQFATPGVNIGLFCSTPAVPIARTLAPKHAMEMLLTGDMIPAKRAAEIGLINRVVDKEQLSSDVMALAEKIAVKSRSAIRIGKDAYHKQVIMDIEAAYEYAGMTMVDNMCTSDAKEGITAFLQKREPTWKDV